MSQKIEKEVAQATSALGICGGLGAFGYKGSDLCFTSEHGAA